MQNHGSHSRAAARYDSDHANEVQRLIYEYCQTEGDRQQVNFQRLQNYVRSIPPQEMNELLSVNRNGFSLLIEAEHLPFRKDMPGTPEEQRAKAQLLSRYFMEMFSDANKKGHLDKKAYAAMLTTRTMHHFSALDCAVLNRDREVYTALKGQIQELVKTGALSPAHYAQQFTHMGEQRFTPLFEAVRAGDTEIFKDILREIKQLTGKGIIPQAEYDRLFTTRTGSGYTLVQAAVTGGNTEIYTAIEQELRAFRERNSGNNKAQKIYARQFTNVTHQNYSVLQDAVCTQNPAIFRSVLDILRALHVRKLVSDSDYAETLLNGSTTYFTPLLDAVRNGNLEIYEELASELKALQAQGLITREQHASLYTRHSGNCSVALHEAVLTGNPKLFTRVVENMAEVLSESELQAQLKWTTNNGWNIYHVVTKPQPEGNPLLADMIEAIHDAFFQHFGNKQPFNNPEAMAEIDNLMKHRTNKGYLPVHGGQPEWQQLLLDLHRKPRGRDDGSTPPAPPSR